MNNDLKVWDNKILYVSAVSVYRVLVPADHSKPFKSTISCFMVLWLGLVFIDRVLASTKHSKLFKSMN